MKTIINSDNIDILNTYITLKNNNFPTNLFEKKIDDLEIKYVDKDTIVERGKHEGTVGGYCPYENNVYLLDDKNDKNVTKHELLHFSSADFINLDNFNYQEYGNFHYVPFSGISVINMGGKRFGTSLNEGLTETLRVNYFPDKDEKYEMCLSYKTMMVIIGMIKILTNEKEIYDAYFNNDSTKFYKILNDLLGNNWYKFIEQCDDFYEYNLKTDHKNEFISHLLDLRMHLTLLNSIKNNKNNKKIDYVIQNKLFDEVYNYYFMDHKFTRKYIKSKLEKQRRKHK